MGEYKLLLEHVTDPKFRTLDGYRATGGYRALEKALAMDRQAVVDSIKASGLRGRGGAGAPAALKWGGMPKEKTKPHYLICNADEGEPGTFKDKELMEACPFEVIEGMTIAAHAVQGDAGYIYIRAEFMDGARSIRAAIDGAYAAGLLGKNILGSGLNFDLYVHLGAGSYECGEETALMSSLMGERGMPRLKFPHAPFPVVSGVWDRPTLIHNVESYCCVNYIIDRGAEWWSSLGASTKNSRGTKIFSVSGHVNKPGNYEIEFGTPLKELLALAGGIRGGTLKACIAGGSSMPIIDAESVDVAILGYEELNAVKTSLGSGGCMFFNHTTDIVRLAWRTAVFYMHESCGKCTPCREGTQWMVQILERILAGGGRPGDIELLKQVAGQIDGRSFCPLGEAAAWPIQGMLRVFPQEFEHYIASGRSLVAA